MPMLIGAITEIGVRSLGASPRHRHPCGHVLYGSKPDLGSDLREAQATIDTWHRLPLHHHLAVDHHRWRLRHHYPRRGGQGEAGPRLARQVNTSIACYAT